MAKEICRSRTYVTKLISHLPHEYRLANDSKCLVVDYATTDLLGQCRIMIEEAALRGDNVGVDEYEKDGESIEMLLRYSEIFQAKDPATGRIEAFMIIQPCLYQRTYDPSAASVYVFRTKDIHVDDEVYAELMSLVADFAKDIDTGYIQCFTQVAMCHHGLYMQLRRRGFLTVAVLPNWVNIVGANLKDNAILVKDFELPERPLRSSEEVIRMLESRETPRRVFEDYTSEDLPQIPGLPKTFQFENGTKLVLRNMKKDEDHLLYKMFSNTETKGEGFSIYEFPTLNVMRLGMLANGYAAAVEEEATRRLMGFLVYNDSAMSRSGKGKVCEGSAIVSEELRETGLGDAFLELDRFIRAGLGYEKLLREMLFDDSLALNIFKDDVEVSARGVLPRGSFQKGVGWVDLVFSVVEFDQKHDCDSQETIKSRL